MSKISVHGSFTPLKLKLITYRNVFVVCDKNVREYALKIASGKPLYEITADEDHKNMDSVIAICEWLLANGAGRDALVLAVGGGVTTDMVGFASSIYKRGVRYANIPTTLLCMVDAGIGGKTGVNHQSLKNMLGIIRQPEFTYICPEVLNTLPDREMKSGAAEMLKTFVIKDRKDNYSKAVKVFSNPFDVKAISPLIQEAAKVKSDIVEKDELETGLRRVLNLGHTYGHAIEWWQKKNASGMQYTHGEAVAIGMVEAARISEEMGIAKAGLADKIAADFRYCGLPTEMPCDKSELEQAVKQDKKAEGGKVNFVLIKDIGKVVVKKI